MHLDMLTMSVVDITVTTILGVVLVLNGAPGRGTSFVSWWGLAMLLQAAGVAIAAVSSFQNAGDALTIGTAMMVLADATNGRRRGSSLTAALARSGSS